MTTGITIASLGIAGLSIISSGLLQWRSMIEQRELKQYEVSFKPKQEAYSSFMGAFTKAEVAAVAHEQANMLDGFNRMESAYFLFEPFLPPEKRGEVLMKFSEFTSLCNQEFQSTLANAIADDSTTKVFYKQLTPYKVYFQNELYNDLFKQGT
jgi:hypothetical protein